MHTCKYHLGDNCIQNFHLGRCIVGYMVGNLILRQCASGAVKLNFGAHIQLYTSPNENFGYGYPDSNALLQSRLKLEATHSSMTSKLMKSNYFQQYITGYYTDATF